MGSGNPESRVMLVGEAWGETEERTGIPFTGVSGVELNKMLQEAGILRSDCYATNVVNARPYRNRLESWIPERKGDITSDMVRVRDRYVKPIVAEGIESLRREIELVQPQVIVALGTTALWALTGHNSIVRWRGSLLETSLGEVSTRVIPTYHPAAVLRMWEWRAVAVQDLRRVARHLHSPVEHPRWSPIIRPTYEQVIQTLETLLAAVEESPLWIDLDLETKAGHIDCCGLSWTRTDSICIPFMSKKDYHGYWSAEEEGMIVHLLRKFLTHKNCWVRGQNILYDCQYIYRYWMFIPNVKQDTMISQHVLWAGMPKSLAFQASMYCEWYVNWKPDKDTWKEGG